ncbi:SRPBCC family protein [Tamlana sp. I1]|uniref:SRPBCC family protein n=1 Tax=Tamlana sp. I1 TaxID=2762061 RepID=UPI00188F6BDE|nr:SRPBCC family protein [Tamlana sp. I1]
MKVIYCFFVVLFISNMGYAQMPLAREIPPKYEKRMRIKAPIESVWDYLLAFEKLSEYGSEIISESNISGTGIGTLREVVLKNGEKRSEMVDVIAPTSKKIGIIVLNPNKSIFERYAYYFQINRANEHACFVTLKAYYNLIEGVKKSDVNKDVSTEFDVLLNGLKHHFEN